MTDEDKKIFDLIKAYEKKFGESVWREMTSQMTDEEWMAKVQHCIDTNTRFEYSKVPKGWVL